MVLFASGGTVVQCCVGWSIFVFVFLRSLSFYGWWRTVILSWWSALLGLLVSKQPRKLQNSFMSVLLLEQLFWETVRVSDLCAVAHDSS